jgi:hypothetical protein
LVEIKPYKECIPPVQKSNKKTYITEVTTYVKNKAKWEAAETYCKAKRWQFLVITEKTLYNR